MGAVKIQEEEIRISYSLVWGWLHLANHRFGTMPTGQMQVTLTIIMLNSLGYDPTVTELAEITGLAKSNVSRYVSGEMRAGFLEEYIDPGDRRRRKLRPTEKAGGDLESHAEQVKALYGLVRQQQDVASKDGIDFNMLIKNLRKIIETSGVR